MLRKNDSACSETGNYDSVCVETIVSLENITGSVVRL